MPEPTTIDLDQFEKALLAEFAVSEDQAHRLGLFIAEALSGKVADAELKERLASDQATASMLPVLAGRTVPVGGTAVNFGSGNQIGTVRIGEAAGRDIIRLGPQFVFNLIYPGMFPGAAALLREAILRLAEDYNVLFGGRAEPLRRLDTFLDQPDRPFGLICEPLGRGKTALLINWATRVRAAGAWTVIFAPINRTYDTAAPDVALRIVAMGLAANANIEGFGDPPPEGTSAEDMKRYVSGMLRNGAREGRKLLLIIDGLDEAEQLDTVQRWSVDRLLFPRSLGPNVKVIAAASEEAGRNRSAWLAQLGWEEAGRAEDVALGPLTYGDVEDIVRRTIPCDGDSAAWIGLVDHVVRAGEGDPLTVKLLVQALQDKVLAPCDLTALEPGLKAAMRIWLKELEDAGALSKATYDLLGLCATAMGPLDVDDLQELAPESLSRMNDVKRAVGVVSRFLIGAGDTGVGYAFAHRRLKRLYLTEELTRKEVGAFRDRFVAYGRAWYDRKDGSAPPPYVRRFWVAHLAEAGEWGLAEQVLTELVGGTLGSSQPWVAARFAAEGNHAGYLADLDRLWNHAIAAKDPRLALRCAVISGSLRSLSGRVPVELLTGLVTVGSGGGPWSMTAALEQVWIMPSELMQIDAFRALVGTGEPFPTAWALGFAADLLSDYARAETIGVLARSLDDALMPQALAMAIGIETISERAFALATLAPRSRRAFDLLLKLDTRWTWWMLPDLPPKLPLGPRAEVVERTLAAARELTDVNQRCQVLVRIAHWLPPERFGEAIELTKGLGRPKLIAEALRALAHWLPPDRLADAGALAEGLRDARGKTMALAALGRRIGGELPRSAFEAARGIAEPECRAKVLGRWARRWPDDLRGAAFSRAREAALSVPSPSARAQALAALARKLPKEQKAACLDEAVTAARAVVGPSSRARLLATLAERLPPARRSDLLNEALDAALTIPGEGRKTMVLAMLSAHLSAKQVGRVLGAASRFEDERHAAQLIEAIAPRLPVGPLQGLLDVSLAFEDERARVRALTALARRLGRNRKGKMIEAARGLQGGNRVRVLVALAASLSKFERASIYAEALSVTRHVGDLGPLARLFAAIARESPEPRRREVFAEALKCVGEVRDERERAQTLVELAAYGPPEHWEDALPAVLQIEDIDDRARALVAFIRIAPEGKARDDALTKAVEDAKAAASDKNWPDLAPLREVTEVLPGGLTPDLLETLRQVPNQPEVAEVLEAAAARLSADALDGAWQLAREMEDEGPRASTLAALAPRFEGGAPPGTLDLICELAHDGPKSLVLAAVAPLLRTEELPKALEIARALTDPEPAASALVTLSQALNGDLARAVWDEAAAAARRADAPSGALARALTEVVGHSPADVHDTVAAETLAAIAKIDDDDVRGETIASLVPALPDRLVVEALDLVCKIPTARAQVSPLAALASRVSPDILPRAVEAVHGLGEARDVSRLLGALALRLDGELLAEALTFACSMAEDSSRTPLLAALAPRLVERKVPADLAARALRLLAARGRPVCLLGLAELLPWIRATSAKGWLDDMHSALVDVSRCWP